MTDFSQEGSCSSGGGWGGGGGGGGGRQSVLYVNSFHDAELDVA